LRGQHCRGDSDTRRDLQPPAELEYNQ